MAATDNISGHEGTFSYEGSDIPITAWTLNQTGETKDVTDSSSSTNTERIPEGHTAISGSFEAFVKDGTATPTVGGAAGAFILQAESGITWQGDGIITSKNIVATIKGGDAVKMSLNFEGTGASTETNS
jgi:hypothetical protein